MAHQRQLWIQSGPWFERKWGTDAGVLMRVRNGKSNLPDPAFQPSITWSRFGLTF